MACQRVTVGAFVFVKRDHCTALQAFMFVERDHCAAFWAVQDPSMTPTSFLVRGWAFMFEIGICTVSLRCSLQLSGFRLVVM